MDAATSRAPALGRLGQSSTCCSDVSRVFLPAEGSRAFFLPLSAAVHWRSMSSSSFVGDLRCVVTGVACREKVH